MGATGTAIVLVVDDVVVEFSGSSRHVTLKIFCCSKLNVDVLRLPPKWSTKSLSPAVSQLRSTTSVRATSQPFDSNSQLSSRTSVAPGRTRLAFCGLGISENHTTASPSRSAATTHWLISASFEHVISPGVPAFTTIVRLASSTRCMSPVATPSEIANPGSASMLYTGCNRLMRCSVGASVAGWPITATLSSLRTSPYHRPSGDPSSAAIASQKRNETNCRIAGEVRSAELFGGGGRGATGGLRQLVAQRVGVG